MKLMLCLAMAAAFALLASLQGALGQDNPTLPSLPNFFSGYTEITSTVEGSSGAAINISRSYYDIDTNLARIDIAAQSLDPSGTGTVSIIQDTDIGIVYSIHRQYSNCTVAPLSSYPDLNIGEDSRYHLKSLNELFFLSVVNYTYAGNMSAHGVVLNNWGFSGDFNHNGFNYTNSKLQLSVTQNGQNVPSISSITSSPIPWRFSLQGLVTSTDTSVTNNISSVFRFFDLSFDEPTFDIFDISICVDSRDSILMTLAVPGLVNGVNLGEFRGNVRKAISTYAEIYPIQVGNVEITNTNETFIFITLQISNLTAAASVSDRKTAKEAYQMIIDNTVNGEAPFQIELTSGSSVTPFVVMPNETQNCSTTTITSTQTQYVTVSPTDYPFPTPTPVIITTTTTFTVSPTASCAPVTSGTCPPSAAMGVSEGHVVGIAFGTLITGAVVACISMLACIFCYQRRRTRPWSSFEAGYQKHQNHTTLDKEREYFQ